MVDEENQAENARDEEKKRVFRKGKKIEEGTYQVHIQPNEPILHGILRAKIEWWHYNKMNSLLLTIGVGLLFSYALYHYFGDFFGIIVGILIFVVTPVEFWEEKQRRRTNIVKVRVYRPQGILVPMDMEIGEDKKVNMYVYKPEPDEKGRAIYEEWAYSKRLNDPNNPKAITRIDAPMIDTGFSTVVFAIEVKPKERVIIGDDGKSIPVMGLIDLIEETHTYINKGMEEINRLREKNRISLEDFVEAQEKANAAREAFNSFMNYVKEKGIQGKFLKDLNKTEQQLVVALNRDTSEVFTHINEIRNWRKNPRAIRQGKVISAINTMNGDMRKASFWIAHEQDVRREVFADVLTAMYNNSGRDPKNDLAFTAQLNSELEKLLTKEEHESVKEVVADEDQ